MNDTFDRIITFLTKEKTKCVLCFVLYLTIVITTIEPNLPIVMQLVLLIITVPIIIIFSSVYLTFWLNDMSCKIESVSESIWKELKKIVKEIIFFFIFLVISYFIESHLFTGISENQTQIINEFYKAPIFSIITVVIIGPIIEEFVFRYLPYQFISNKKMYIVISSIIFASMHVINDPNALYYIWGYLTHAIYYGYRYYKTKDLSVTISIHMFNNLLATLPLIILYF